MEGEKQTWANLAAKLQEANSRIFELECAKKADETDRAYLELDRDKLRDEVERLEERLEELLEKEAEVPVAKADVEQIQARLEHLLAVQAATENERDVALLKTADLKGKLGNAESKIRNLQRDLERADEIVAWKEEKAKSYQERARKAEEDVKALQRCLGVTDEGVRENIGVTWEDFRDAGMLWFINRQLHVFGWVLKVVVSIEAGEKGKAIGVFPERTTFRGFSEADESAGYHQLRQHLGLESERA